MLNWNSQRVSNNSSSLQPERHVPLTFKTKQNLLLKRQPSAQERACCCRRADKVIISAAAHRSAKTRQAVKRKRKNSKWASFWSSAGSSEKEEMHRSCAVLLLCPEHRCPPAGRGGSGARGGSRGQRWVPWFSGIICSRAGGLMGLLAVICNPAKNRRCNSPLCLDGAGMQQAARDGQGAHPQLPNPGKN